VQKVLGHDRRSRAFVTEYHLAGSLNIASLDLPSLHSKLPQGTAERGLGKVKRGHR